MIKALLRFTRALVGIWSEIRRIRILLEWLFANGLTGTASYTDSRLTLSILPVHLPPTAKEIREAQEQKIEHQEMDEEQAATERAAELLKRRAKGETIPEEEVGSDFDLY